MWVFTTDGFYSVVQDRNDPERLVVRSRWREDLVNFLRRIGRKDLLKNILESAMTDYEFRVFVPRIYWAEFLRLHSSIMDYHNFKDEVHLIDPERSHLYSKVWSVVAMGVNRAWGYLSDRAWGYPDRARSENVVIKPENRRNRKAARKAALRGAEGRK